MAKKLSFNGDYPGTKLWTFCSWIIVPATFLFAKLLCLLNKVQTTHLGKLSPAILKNFKVQNRPLITVTNHASLCDPFLIAGTLIEMRQLPDIVDWMPWAPSARDICHRSRIGSLYFRLMKSLPLDRGLGLEQPVMDHMVEVLNNNKWVHIFPEGKINVKKELIPYKIGIGKLITDPDVQPIVIPFYVKGTEDVVPMKKPRYPRIGKRVTFVIGEPIEFSEKVTAAIESRTGDRDVWSKITEELRVCMDKLQEIAEREHAE